MAGYSWTGAIRRALASTLAAMLTMLVWQPGDATAKEPVSIVVFNFELNDKTAGAGIIPMDAADTASLIASTEKTRQMLAASGLYRVVDTGGVADDGEAKGLLQHCDGCEAQLARKVGAQQSLLGVVNRVSRTEYTVHMYIRDAKSGELLSTGATTLRMGANSSWPRGAKWLLERFLPATAKK